MNSLGSSRSVNAGDPQVEVKQTEPLLKPTKIDLRGDEFWPLSGKPYFHVMLSKTHVGPRYQMVLPAKLYQLLPSLEIPTFLTHKGKNWEMVYRGELHQNKRFGPNWRKFVDDNDLKVGDACVFELMECNCKLLKFRVQILRGDLPLELLDSENGKSADTPIIVE